MSRESGTPDGGGPDLLQGIRQVGRYGQQTSGYRVESTNACRARCSG